VFSNNESSDCLYSPIIAAAESEPIKTFHIRPLPGEPPAGLYSSLLAQTIVHSRLKKQQQANGRVTAGLRAVGSTNDAKNFVCR